MIDLGIAKDLRLDVSDPDSLFGGDSHSHEGSDPEGIGHDVLHTIEDYIGGSTRSEHPLRAAHLWSNAREGPIATAPSTRSSRPTEACCPTPWKSSPRTWSAVSWHLGHESSTGLVNALDGGFVPAGNGGEPIRTPDAYPTGKNFYGINPDKVPKPAAWEMGVELADQMLKDHVEQHGRYPEKVSFVIWGDETMRHHGVLESRFSICWGHVPCGREGERDRR